MNTDTQTVSTEKALELLSDQGRRRLLQHLIETDDGVAELDALIDGIGSGEPRTERTSGQNGDRLRIRLHHVHLPKLAEAGVLEYDARTGAVRYLQSDRIERLLSVVVDERRECAV